MARVNPMRHGLLLLLLLCGSAAAASQHQDVRSFADLQQFLAWFWGHVAAAHKKPSVDAIVDVRLIAHEALDHASGLQGSKPRDSISEYAWATSGDEVGVFASRDLSKGEELFKCPGHLMLTAQRVLATSALGEVLTTDEQDSNPEKVLVEQEDVLALYALSLRFGESSSASGEDSTLQAWVDMWPARIETPLLWSLEDADTYLPGTNLYDTALNGYQAELERFKVLKQSLLTQQQLGLEGVELTFEMWAWAVSFVQSRKVDLQSRNGAVFPAIVPMLDMFNHRFESVFADPEFKLPDAEHAQVDGPSYGWNAEKRTLFVQANRDYKAGEQIFLTYGRFSTRELLEWFGFVPPGFSNPYDKFLVSPKYLRIDPRDQYKDLVSEKQKLLKKYEEADEDLFLGRNSVSELLIEAAYVINSAPQDFNLDPKKGPIGPEMNPKKVSPETLQNVYQWFQFIVRRNLADMTHQGDPRPDREIINDKSRFSALTHTQQLMLQYALSEKELLFASFRQFKLLERDLLRKNGINPDTNEPLTEEQKENQKHDRGEL